MNLTVARTEAWRLACLSIAFFVFSSPTIWVKWKLAWPSYVPATIALAVVLVVVVLGWTRSVQSPQPAEWPASAVFAAVASGVIIAIGAWRWVDVILANPIDANRADMLPVIDAALRRFIHGHDPYGIYHVPWEAPLGYGPVLWGPFLVPHALRTDLRVASIAGEILVPIWCGIAATLEAMRGRFDTGLLWIALLAAILVNPDLKDFSAVAHTPVYWPLLPLFALLAAAERWRAAAFVLGLIVVARSTMVAGVPIFFMAVWTRDRKELISALALSAIPIVALMLPFFVWDPHALWYGMVAVYPTVIKKIVWPSPDLGVVHTIGVTGWLVAHHLERYVEVTQAVAVLGVNGLAWSAIRKGARPLPWMAVAVLAFCMTTLWPLYYIYFDVLLLLVSAAVAEAVGVLPRFLFPWAATVAASVLLVVATVLVQAARFPRMDFTSTTAKRWLYQGMTMPDGPGEAPLAWIWGFDGTIAVPRSSTSSSDIVISAEPVMPADVPIQRVAALLNGRPLGTVDAPRGWQSLRFHAPADAWQFGANELKLVCASVARPVLIGMSGDPRQLSLAIRRIDVVPAVGPRDEP